jgi:hypothetical protein
MNEIKINTFFPTKPHAKQQEVLDALDGGERFIQLRAGRKFRKTSLLISWLTERALQTGLTCPYVAPNRIQAKNIAWNDHIPRLLTHFKAQGLPYKVNEVELTVTFPRGRLQLLGVENREALRGISNWGAFAGDEYDDWEEDIWPTVIRPNLITNNAPAILAGTPKGYRNLYRVENLKNEQGIPLFKSFHFRSHDNPDLDPAELAALEIEYKQLGEGYYRQEILAEYEKPHGTVYAEWDMERQYVDFNYDPNLPVELFWDFGVNDPTALGVMQPYGNELRLVDYYEAANANIEHFTQWFAATGYRTPAFEAGDIAGRSRELVSGKSPINELNRLGHFVRTTPIPSIPAQVRHAHRFIPRLFVSKSNPNTQRFVECITNYRYPADKSATALNQTNEIPMHDEFSHALRGWEYYCWNKYEPRQEIAVQTPANSVMGYLRKKEQQRLVREELYGY